MSGWQGRCTQLKLLGGKSQAVWLLLGHAQPVSPTFKPLKHPTNRNAFKEIYTYVINKQINVRF